MRQNRPGSTVMRPWTIAIHGAVAFALAAPMTADARPRFGPGAILGAFAAPLAVLGGARPSAARRHQRNAQADSDATDGRRARRQARIEAATENPAPPGSTSAPAKAAFWPRAADDLLDYAFFPKRKDEAFWTIGYGAILGNAFALANAEEPRARRNRSASSKVSDAAGATKLTDLPGALDACGNRPAASSADQLIERIEQAIRPSDAQREILGELRAALVRAIERINSACPTSAPTTTAERLQAIHDRISAMHDALLTLRLPFEDRK